MNSGFIFTLIGSFTIIYIGIITTFHDRTSITNKLFAFVSIATVFWGLVNYFSLEPIWLSTLVWARLVLFFAIPHVVLFYFFTRNFPNKEFVIPKKQTIILSITSIAVMILTLTPFVFKDIDIHGTPVPGSAIPIFALFIILILIASIVQISIKYFKAEPQEKTSWRSMLFGFIISYVLLIWTNFILVNTASETRYIIYGPLFMLPTVIGTAYSILRYKLLNVKAIATEILIFVLLSITLVQIVLSQSTSQFVFNSILFCVFLLISIFLIKSVLTEVEQKERLQILSDELAIANNKLKDLDKLKTEFLSLASHQLRSPLTAIKGYTSMLLDGSFGAINDGQKEAVDRVFQSSNHLTKVVGDLLNVSKIEQGGMKYEMMPFDLAISAKELAQDLSITAEKKGLKLSFETDAHDPYTVNGDMEKIRQVLLNFIDNSIKYTKEGWIKVSVTNIPGNKIRFAVSDSGMGMTPETKSSLFQKFNRGEGGKVNTGGSGLGLYLAKQIVEAHKGRVGVDSDGVGKGSTFFAEFQRM